MFKKNKILLKGSIILKAVNSALYCMALTMNVIYCYLFLAQEQILNFSSAKKKKYLKVIFDERTKILIG